MARPKLILTALAVDHPERAKRQIRTAFHDASYEYPHAAALLGVSVRVLRNLCSSLELSEEFLKGRVGVGGDRRGRPPIATPAEKVLRKVLKNEGSFTKAARAFGVAPPTVARWARELGIAS